MITGEYIGGFRVVRTLGMGSRAEVYLGHGGGERVAAIKVYNPAADLDSIDTEIEALHRADHAHCLQLRDVASAPDGLPCLILERLGHGSLAQLLAGRAALSPGEAVTVLAPLVAAIGALHSSGVVHGALSPRAVLFRETGAPVLAGFGHAVLLQPGASAALLAGSRAVTDDRVALARLVTSVLTRVSSTPATRLTEWLAQVERDGFADGLNDELELRVFDLGAATPVRFARDAEDRAPVRLPQRLHTAEPLRAELEVLPGPPRVASLARLPILEDLSTRVRPWLGRLRLPDLRGVRRPVWVAAAVGVAVLVIALLAVPEGDGGAASPPPVPTASALSAGAVAGDDPVAALADLLASRATCIRDLSILCLENAVQSGSAAMDDDVTLIRGIEDGSTTGTQTEQPTQLTLVERHGDAALVSYSSGINGQPASALLVKGEAGWRIRDYVATG